MREERQVSQTPRRERRGNPSSDSSFRGSAVQRKLGRSPIQRSSRPASRDRKRRWR